MAGRGTAERPDGQDPPKVLRQAEADFGAFVAARQGALRMWDVPVTLLWYVAGSDYLGELVIRHELTPALLESGGHIGYSVAQPFRRQGHGTRMLAAGLVVCRALGLTRVLLTCDSDNEGSRRVILANGGRSEGTRDGEDRFWIDVPS